MNDREWETKVLIAKAFGLYDEETNTINQSSTIKREYSNHDIGWRIDKLSELIELVIQTESSKAVTESLTTIRKDIGKL